MEVKFFHIFIEVLRKEQIRFQLNETHLAKFVRAVNSSLSENFDIGYNRCAFMYRYSTCYTFFVKECITRFLTECPVATDLVSSWRNHSDLGLCSLSPGPGLDFLSFNLALLAAEDTRNVFHRVNVIAKNGAWRNTVGFLTESMENVSYQNSSGQKNVNFKNVKVIQGDIFKLFTENVMNTLEECEVLLMFKTINLSANLSPGDEESLLLSLYILVSFLRPTTTIFFIDTKPSMSVMEKLLLEFVGSYLYDPVHLTFRLPEAFTDVWKETFSVPPVLRTQGTFFVWQKSPSGAIPNSTLSPRCIPHPDFPIDFESPKSVSSNISLSDHKGNKSDSPFELKAISCCSPESVLPNSISRASNDPFDLLLTGGVNGISHINPFRPEIIESPKKVCDETEGSKDIKRDSAFQAVFNAVVSSPSIYNTPHDRCPLFSSESRSSNMQNEIQKGHKSGLPSSESKLIQTDPVVETMSINSIRLLTDKINQLICTVEKELRQPNKNPGVHVGRCHRCYLFHPCSSYSQDCYIAQSLDNNCAGLRNTGFSDSEQQRNENACSECRVQCSASRRGCNSQPLHVQCCHRHHVPQCQSLSGALFQSSPMSAKVPSIVIPIQNLNEETLFRIISDLKKM